MDYTTIQACRGCGAASPVPVLELGQQPLANALKASAGEPEQRYPLSLVFCESCGLVQIAETVAKERLFSTYVWVTGTSSTARLFAYEFSRKANAIQPVAPGDLVIEVASNDGTFLRPFLEAGCRVVGVDPASNIAQMANERGLPTVNAFWQPAVARTLTAQHGPARFVFARNVIAHASDLHDVVDAMAIALAEDGLGAVEFHSALHILEDLQYDSIYHEHLCYFSAVSFEGVLRSHALHPVHVEFSPISGGAHIIYFARQPRPSSAAYSDVLERERRAGVDRLGTWQQFAARCRRHRERSLEVARSFAGRTVVGFGASARSATYLNFCGFTGAHLAAIIDNSELKWHRYSPGSSIKIVPADEGFALGPDLIVVLAWNFSDEIVDACRARGYTGAFLVPLPNEPRMIETSLERPT